MTNASLADLADDPDAVAHSRKLVRRIAADIARCGGWIGFDRYMQLALYAPGLGYYAGGATKFGGAGDFITAPELSSLFSQTLAVQVAEVLADTAGDVLELGAGSGRMATDMLQALDANGALPRRYVILEVSGALSARQKQRVRDLPLRLASRVEWIDRTPWAFRGVVVCNEVLDALPTHLIVWGEDGIYERGIAWNGEAFVWEDRPLTDPRLSAQAKRLGLQASYVSEVSQAVPALVRTLAGVLETGVLLIVDYGFGEREYYHPQRNRGTLMCHFRHRTHGDPFFAPGLQDITSHVDFTGVAQAATEAGLGLLGYVTQAQFLINLGITDLIARTPAADAATYLPLAAQAHKLLSPAEMGELFKVIALGRGLDRALTGFRSGDLSRLL
ncbi:MAG TPA: SAM-dependent methyltransferase [Burkholderiales bacterium]|nr:SAM-dependent methyltransferase [Burkholderiales bacterium]